MDITSALLVGIITNLLSFEVGNRLTSRNKVSERTCEERRASCSEKVCIKLDALHERLDNFPSFNK